ncbi:CLUMA_CG008442, isoform A [Clunio marinus]|uniref:CLUMA_CG008442, isoform A n=1 Tax=Clunio marinus TaxID=568069 RepID=A0A1J1I5D2_9DIPT|nr:CLUMA_CG008442, isoform A [Clunio marinus]
MDKKKTILSGSKNLLHLIMMNDFLSEMTSSLVASFLYIRSFNFAKQEMQHKIRRQAAMKSSYKRELSLHLIYGRQQQPTEQK